MRTSGVSVKFCVLAFALFLAACGRGDRTGGDSSGNPGNNPPPPVTGTLALFAGNLNGPGTADGSGATAQFNRPQSVAVDSTGNVYVADTTNLTIRKITPDGVVSTLAGSAGMYGSADGTGAAARFSWPTGVATDSADNVYVSDWVNNTIRKITPDGVVSTLAGKAAAYGSADGSGAAARFNGPSGVATDGAGNVYVADTYNFTIRKITPAGVVSTLAGTAGVTGSADGSGPAASFNVPDSVATDSAGNVYVADAANKTIRKITPAGAVSTLAGTAGVAGSADGSGAAASFNVPIGVATDSAGNVYVADRVNSTIRKITPAGVVSTLAGLAGGTGSADGSGAAARFNSPLGVATDIAGNVYVADTDSSTIRKVTPAGVVSTLAGFADIGSADDSGAAAQFNRPRAVATDSAGNLYVADTYNHTIRKITPAGMVSTLAGSAGVAGSADGTGAAARFNYPSGVATDSAGNVYVADTVNFTIRKITPAGVVSTLAGKAGVAGSNDVNTGSGGAATFNYPQGVTTDGAGNVYVADSGNGTIRKITQIAPSLATVRTLAGTAGVFGYADGTGAAARFATMIGLATDSAGNVYVAEVGGPLIRKITPAGVVSTLAGSSGIYGSTDGTGAAAQFDQPFGVATDSAGNVYVADTYNDRIRKVTRAGVVSTVSRVSGQSGFTPGPLLLAQHPWGIAISGSAIYTVMDNGVAAIQLTP
jgi:NHL repeat